MEILYALAFVIRFILFTIASPLQSGLSSIKSEKVKMHWQICGTEITFPPSPDFYKISSDKHEYFIQAFPEGYFRISSF